METVESQPIPAKNEMWQGRWFNFEFPCTPIQELFVAYSRYDELKRKATKIGTADELPTRAELFKMIAQIYWGPHSRVEFKWHPWAEKMNEEAHRWKYLGIVGAASTGKSDFGAIYAIIKWLEDPLNTSVFVTSTSLKDSQHRIWGAVVKYFEAVPGLPGKLVPSMGLIRTTMGGEYNPRNGIMLLAGEKKKERECIGKLIGFKNKRVILIADELPELSHSLAEAAKSNLSCNPKFQMIGIGNLVDPYNPLGEFVTPQDGWESVNPDSEEWATKLGWCLRFDGLKSPNVLAGKDIWPIYGNKELREHRRTLGPDTVAFWRMCRSFLAPLGADDTIYSEADLVAGHAYQKIYWLQRPTRVASMDPSFTTGGDRSVAFIGDIGISKDGVRTLQFDKHVVLREDVTKKNEPRNFQIAKAFRDLCVKEGVAPENAAIDATAAGRLMHDILCVEWSNKVMAVEFGGAPSELPCTVNGNTTCKEAYDRKVSEIWYAGVEFIKAGQIRGVMPELASEMRARRYKLVKRGSLTISVETKPDMKLRVGFSPDIADGAFVMLDLCRNRHGFTPAGTITTRASSRDAWLEMARANDKVNHEQFVGSDDM